MIPILLTAADAPPDGIAGAVAAFVAAVVGALGAYLAARIRAASATPHAPVPVPPPALDEAAIVRLLADERAHVAEVVLAQFRAHYGDRLASLERHFERVESAVLGAGVTGRDGIARRVEAIEDALNDLRDRPRTRPGD